MITRALLAILFLSLISCSQKHANQPSISDICKTQLMKFIEEGTKTKTMAEQGVAYKDLRQQVANTKSAYELVTVSCAANLLGDSRQEFERAIKGWDLAIKLCDHAEDFDKNLGNHGLVFSSSDEYRQFMEYADDRLETNKDIGGTFLKFEQNISILNSIAGERFLAGRSKILQTLQQPQ